MSMDSKDTCRTLVQALRRQLGADGGAVDLIETHVSWVLLAGDSAYKIKKPLRLGFLDFGSLDRRKHFCQEELRLNRRYSPSVYLGVLAIGGTPQQPRLGGEGPAIEYALHMRRFAPRSLLSEKLADGQLQPGHIDALAQRMAALHAGAERAPPGSAWGSAEAVAEATGTVLQRLHERGAGVADLQRWWAERIERLSPLWQQRRDGGWVRECHGDLHLRNAVVLEDGVSAFDGLEFDPALRWIDVQSDIAFMVMDLLAHERADLAWRFLNAWLDATGDHQGVPVLRSYLVHRSLVRSLVGRIDVADAKPSADDYLALARRLAFEPPRPRLLLTHGLSGSGKTHLSQRLLEHSGALRLRSDVERKRLFGLAPLDASAPLVPQGIYGAEATRRTYAQLELRARTLLRAGYPVIVDAASLRHHERARMGRLAAEAAVPFTLLDCRADLQILRQRVRARRQRHDDASEADESVLEQQLQRDEALSRDELAHSIVVHSDQEIDIAALAARWLGSHR